MEPEPTPQPTIPVSAVPVAALEAAGMSALAKALVAFVLIGGGIGVYAFLQRVPAQSDIDPLVEDGLQDDQNDSGVQAQKFPFECSDLFTQADFQRYAIPDRPMAIDGSTEVDILDVADCEFSQRSLNSQEMRVRMFTATINAAGLPGYPSVEEKFQAIKQLPPSALANERNIASAGDVAGVGYKAYRDADTDLYVVSSNQKYLFRIWGVGLDMCAPSACTYDDILQTRIEIAKIVDANISKY